MAQIQCLERLEPVQMARVMSSISLLLEDFRQTDSLSHCDFSVIPSTRVDFQDLHDLKLVPITEIKPLS